MLNVYRHYDDFHTPVIQSGHRNALWEGWEGSNMIQSEESVTLMTFYRFPCYGSRFFANIHNGAFCPVSPVTAALC